MLYRSFLISAMDGWLFSTLLAVVPSCVSEASNSLNSTGDPDGAALLKYRNSGIASGRAAISILLRLKLIVVPTLLPKVENPSPLTPSVI